MEEVAYVDASFQKLMDGLDELDELDEELVPRHSFGFEITSVLRLE
jgi:hypothetical protein